jgi:hypothetical protein
MGGRRTVMLSALACATLALAGCNAVMTTVAVFTPADAAGAPVLKPGYWISVNCSAAAALARAAGCETGYQITPSEMREVDHPGLLPADAPHHDQANPYLLVAGDPMVMQIAFADTSNGQTTDTYIYVAVKPTALDASGGIVAAQVWTVVCGPSALPDPNAPRDQDGVPPATDHPLPGMMLGAIGCMPVDKAALFNAAKASRALGDGVLPLHWVADSAP